MLQLTASASLQAESEGPEISSAAACGRYVVLVLALAAVLMMVRQPANAQTLAGPHFDDTLYAAPYDANTFIPPTRGAGKVGLQPTADIRVTYDSDFPTAARAAFEFAVSIWETYLQSSIPINVSATWESLGENTLGSAGPRLVGNFGAGARDTWYASALAESIVGEDFTGTRPDIEAFFNSSFADWYFGTDGNVPTGKYDFVTVVVHELGHGLGFTGSFDIEDGIPTNEEKDCPNTDTAGLGCWGLFTQGGALFPFIFDQFAEDASETSLLNTSAYPNPSTQLATVLQSGSSSQAGNVFFDGGFSRAVNEDVPISLYAPSSFEAGSSYSHLDEDTFPFGNINSLMTPFVARREVIHSPGPVTCAILQDMGWVLGPDCIALVSTGVAAFTVAREERDAVLTFSLNPARQVEDVEVQLRYFNTEFRTVAVLPGGSITGEVTSRVEDLEPGTYMFRLKVNYADGGVEFSAAQEIMIPLTATYALEAFYPNPVVNRTRAVLLVNEPQQVYVEVYNAAGGRVQTILNRNVEAEQPVEILLQAEGLAAGIYFIHVVGENFKATRQVVRVR